LGRTALKTHNQVHIIKPRDATSQRSPEKHNKYQKNSKTQCDSAKTVKEQESKAIILEKKGQALRF
jgi:hypothetical protein